ncbi:uncharacterized protein LOC144633530 [Oculina patagonica]
MSREITTKDILMLLPLIGLSLADPITDILTLMEFYSSGHENWFAVGLIFLILPCFAFSVHFCRYSNESNFTRRTLRHSACLCGFHPFSVAVQRLEAFIVCSRKYFWHGERIVEDSHEFVVLESSKRSALVEAIFESAPQFVIQLYVVSVQQEPVSIIQRISLPVSFGSLVWSFHAADEYEIMGLPVKHKISNFLTHFLLLSARLFAITYFVVAYKWFIICFFINHFIILRIMHCCWPYGTADGDSDNSTCEKVFKWYLIFGISWIGYETFEIEGNGTETAMKHLKIIKVFSYILLALENFAMILLYYNFYIYSVHPWYSLQLTESVCSCTFIGVVIRFFVAHKLFKFYRAVQPEQGA